MHYWQSLSVKDVNQNLTNQQEKWNHICNEFRTSLHPMLDSLRYLGDNLANTPEEQTKLITAAYQDTIFLLRQLEELENLENLEDLEHIKL